MIWERRWRLLLWLGFAGGFFLMGHGMLAEDALPKDDKFNARALQAISLYFWIGALIALLPERRKA